MRLVICPILIASSHAWAQCPLGYQQVAQYDTSTESLKWLGVPDSQYQKCLNTSSPEMNTLKDSYGLRGGASSMNNYQCGSIKVVHGSLNTAESGLLVMPSDPSLKPIRFNVKTQPNIYGYRPPDRAWCENGQDMVTCYREYIDYYTYENDVRSNVPLKQIGRKHVGQSIQECKLISF